MSLSEEVLVDARRERRIPVLKTERLTLRAPRPEDVTAHCAPRQRSSHRREHARLPHPYGVSDAEHFVAIVNQREGEACFVIMLDGR